MRKERPAKGSRAPRDKALERALREHQPKTDVDEILTRSKRKALEWEVRKLQGGMAATGVVLLAVAKIGFATGAPWVTLPAAAGAVYLMVRSYRKISSVRAEAEKLGVRSDEIDTAAENAVMPFKTVGILGGVLLSVMLGAILLVWLAQKLQ